MQYIQCTRCGHLNTVKSENILFCEQCNKRLPDNFIDWHKNHPDKTFEDFSRIYCISDYAMAARSQAPVKTLKTPLIAVFSVILIIILSLGGYFLFRKSGMKTPENIENGRKWTRTDIGKSGIILDLPFELVRQTAGEDDTTHVESYSQYAAKGFKIFTSYKVYEGMPLPIADTLIQNKITEVRKTEGIKNFRWNRSDTLIGARNGIVVSIQYSLADYRIQQKTVIICDKQYVWQILTQYSEDDDEGRQISDRILASIEIK